MIKRFAVLMILVAVAMPLLAQTATVSRVSGKVEVMPPGAHWKMPMEENILMIAC